MELKECLIDDGHVVEAVYSGAEALEHLAYYEYDIILLDYHMPGAKGDDVCQEYRSSGGVTPVVMLTGDSFEESKTACLNAGANTFVEKTFSIIELNRVMDGFLKVS
jgi:DNA-binding response OmpR family regulator